MNKTSNQEIMLKNLVIEQLRARFSRQYSEVLVNVDALPNLILSNHGLKIAALCVETEGSLQGDRADAWRSIIGQGLKLVLVVPSRSKAKVTSLLWDYNLMTDVSVGTYELQVNVPL